VSVALVIQLAQRMRRIILSSIACPALQNFYTVYHKGSIAGRKLAEHKICFDFLESICLKHFSL
jgi:hypothetical protein